MSYTINNKPITSTHYAYDKRWNFHFIPNGEDWSGLEEIPTKRGYVAYVICPIEGFKETWEKVKAKDKLGLATISVNREVVVKPLDPTPVLKGWE